MVHAGDSAATSSYWCRSVVGTGVPPNDSHCGADDGGPKMYGHGLACILDSVRPEDRGPDSRIRLRCRSFRAVISGSNFGLPPAETSLVVVERSRVRRPAASQARSRRSPVPAIAHVGDIAKTTEFYSDPRSSTINPRPGITPAPVCAPRL